MERMFVPLLFDSIRPNYLVNVSENIMVILFITIFEVYKGNTLYLQNLSIAHNEPKFII